MARKRVGVLISGSGSNLQALIDAASDPAYPAEIALVVSNKADAFGLQRAAKAGIATQVFDHKAYPDRESFDAAMDAALRAAGCEIVCLAGFMRILSRGFVEGWAGRMLNIHPSLLPSFKGLHPQRQALEAGVKVAGCTVHLVTPDLDDGPILEQATVPVLDSDDEAALSARILEQEHRIYPKGLALLAGGAVRIEGRRALTG
ncbi:phosphoribosylglycinamide formyltransferase [Thalassobaculum litoreum]|uniref:Phosphoribosylglycinamide formyltransferase n=1 Tax=Thalassobaculum litoreum DSM 18839 TaxID=1123362 RepID=A0A8G2F0D9_9PROT|nr:phosphoribosylglycinamide formyltransferase [Thalassobaculum litoreum]SDG43660.1 phosphoribosylglycinamide formyltransferase-1 [Thalassobaculum litoreum DSM 18839]